MTNLPNACMSQKASDIKGILMTSSRYMQLIKTKITFEGNVANFAFNALSAADQDTPGHPQAQ